MIDYNVAAAIFSFAAQRCSSTAAGVVLGSSFVAALTSGLRLGLLNHTMSTLPLPAVTYACCSTTRDELLHELSRTLLSAGLMSAREAKVIDA